jgi:hypothetical protein
MSDSQRLHMSFFKVFQATLPDQDDRILDTLAWAVTGVLTQKTISLPAWASCVSDHADAIAREHCFRRWLSNPHVNVRQFYQPFITRALAGWLGQTAYVALDTTSIADHLVIARTALIYRGRAIPLAWQVFKRQSVMLAFEHYQGLVDYTAQLIPPGITVVLLGDRGFRDVRLMTLSRQVGWHFRLRLAENEAVWCGQRQSARLDSWELQPHQPRFLQRVRLTKQRYGPVNIALSWDGDPSHDPWRIVSDQPARLQTLADYAQRMGIDLGFLDDKSAGFQLEDTELLLPHRLNRLLLVTALCTLYLVSVGTQVVAAGQRRLVDSHWKRGLSYLQLGWRWLTYTQSRDEPLPMIFDLDPAPDPEPVASVAVNQSLAGVK